MAGLAVGRDRRDADGAVLVGEVVRLLEHRGARLPRLGDAAVDVGHLEGDVDDAVAVRRVVSASELSGLTAPLTTKRIEPHLRTNALWSRLPFSGPE